MEKRDEILTQESARLVSGYSDFVLQCFSQLRGRDQECLALVELVDQLRRKWKESSEHCVLAEERYHRSEEEKDKLKQEYDLLREMYHDSKAKVGSLLGAKEDLQKQLRDYEQRVKSIRILIENELKDTAAFGQLMDLSKVCQAGQSGRTVGGRATRSQDQILDGVDFDKTGDEEDIDEVHLRYNRTYQRRSKSVDPDSRRSAQTGVTKRSRSRHVPEDIAEEEEEHPADYPTPPKRSREMHIREDEITTVTTVTMDARGRTPTRASVEVHRGKKRSVSESRALDYQSPFTPGSFRVLSTTDLRSPLTAMGSSWTKGRPILECNHSFDTAKGVSLSTLLKNCVVCNRTVTMQNVCKCKDCNIFLHVGCKDKAPMPCIPFVAEKNRKQTPQKGKRALRLADLCPSSPPLVPAILIRLVFEIERRIDQEGLYRIPGSKDLTEKLYHSMMGGAVIPQLQHELSEVLTSVLKKFLVNLKEPLIPTSSYSEFVQAARDPSNDRLLMAIADLPYPNRDTLAFLCVHLQKVARRANENKMPAENLARCIGVSVLMGGRRDMNTLEHNIDQQYSEADKQRKVMQCFLLLPEEYWESYLNSRMLVVSSQLRAASRTPLMNTPRNADQSMLGPVSETPPSSFTPTMRSARRQYRAMPREF